MFKPVLLISANTFKEPYPVYPLGIAYLKGYLNQYEPEIEVLTFDSNLGSLEELGSILEKDRPALIGISLRNIDNVNGLSPQSFLTDYREMIHFIRARSEAPIVLGGAGFSIFPKLIFEWLGADYGIDGEGEIPLLELIRHVKRGQHPEGIAGLLYRRGEVIEHNARGPQASQLFVHLEPQWVSYYWRESGMLNLQSKRGCPFQCSFCSYPTIDGHQVRHLGIERFISGLKQIANEWAVNYFFFTDSVFNIGPAFNRELAKRMIAEKIQVKWGAFFSPKNLAYDDLALFKEAGLSHVELGSDSFSDTMLRQYKKSFGFDEIQSVSESCAHLSIPFAHFLIFGGPGETEASLRETFNRAQTLPPTVFFPALGVRVYPNTPISRLCIQEGLIQSEQDLIQPFFYPSPFLEGSWIKQEAKQTGRSWVFMDQINGQAMAHMRKRGRKGPLWEYLVQ